MVSLTGAAPSKQPVKDMVLEALAAAELTEARAIRIDLDTYFKLLLEFNKRGIHFSNMTIGAKIGQAPEKPTDDFFVDDDAEGDEEM
jgi:18S rRNA (adenine1779-N6/adenine1780-N6)-dimethyltransferase